MKTKLSLIIFLACATCLHAEDAKPPEPTPQTIISFQELKVSSKASRLEADLIKEANVLFSNFYKIDKPMTRLLKLIANKEDKDFFNQDWLYAATFKNNFKFRIQEEESLYRKSEMKSADVHRITAALMMHMPYISAATFSEYQLYRGYLAKNKIKFSPEEQKEVIALITDLEDQFEGIYRTFAMSSYMLNTDDVWAYVVNKNETTEPNQSLRTISCSGTVAAEPLCVPPHEMSDLKR